MLRGILGVGTGLIIAFGLMFVCFSAAYLALAAEGAFRPASYDVSRVWWGVTVVVFALTSVSASAICAKIAPTPASSRTLAAVLMVFWLAMALPAVISAREPAPRIGEVSLLDAMGNARTPPIVAITSAFVAAAGALAGGFIARRRP